MAGPLVFSISTSIVVSGGKLKCHFRQKYIYRWHSELRGKVKVKGVDRKFGEPVERCFVRARQGICDLPFRAMM